jgi:hypothetical protein
MAEPKQIFEQSSKRWIDDHEVIWRYVPLRTLFFYLNGLVFIPSVAKLRAGDPFEGEFYEDIPWFNAAFSDHYGEQANTIDNWIIQKLCSDSERKLIEINKNNPHGANAAPMILRKHYFNFIRQTRFSWCWFHSNRESAAMWSVYGNQGVAIKTTIGKLKRLCEKTERNFIYGRMTYVDYQSKPSVEFDPTRKSDYHLLLRPFFLKRMEYKSEDEVRFVTAGSERDELGGILLKDLKPQDWISAVRLWPGLTSEEESSIQKIVEQYIPKADCERSDLFSGPDGQSSLIKFITDGLNIPLDGEWRDGQDGIPMLIKTL